MKRKAGAKLTRFDITQHLKDPEDAAVYLSQVLADGDDAERPRAFGHIARDQASGQAAAKQAFLRLAARSRASTRRKISRDEMHERR